ncbi:MAG: ATP-binding protein [Raineya sp.]
MQKQVLFPYGVSNFEQLVTQNFVFVDKTKYLEVLEKEKFVSFLRPRKFGKSLWLSVLEYYYDVNQKHKFEKLFGKYYIGKNPTPLQGSYRILKFDFSGINTESKESTKQGFNSNVQTALESFFKFYSNSFSIEEQNKISYEPDAEEKMSKFFRHYPKDIPIYILFDEYDHFTNDILYRDKNEFIDSVSKQGYIRKFYEVIKSATQSGVVDRVFITGVSPVTLDALTSGFNILTHLSHDEKYQSLTGFTEQETRELLRLVLKDPNREDEVMQEMKEWYNGYRFYVYSNENIYNSDMVLYYLKHFKDYQTRPYKMLDVNIAPDYGKLKQMFEIVNFYQNRQVLQTVIENGYAIAPLIDQFSFSRSFAENELVNFLMYLGNLTIEKPALNGIRFKIPNKVIEELYWQYYADRLQSWAEIPDDSYKVYQAGLKMAENAQYEDFFDLIRNLLKNLSNRDFIQFNEKQVKLAIIAYLMLAGVFEVISEREVKSGYPDLMLFQKKNAPYDHHEFIIELKYLKKEQAHELEKTMEEAKNQVLEYYKQDTSLQGKKMLHLLAVVAIKEELFVEEIS